MERVKKYVKTIDLEMLMAATLLIVVLGTLIVLAVISVSSFVKAKSIPAADKFYVTETDGLVVIGGTDVTEGFSFTSKDKNAIYEYAVMVDDAVAAQGEIADGQSVTASLASILCSVPDGNYGVSVTVSSEGRSEVATLDGGEIAVRGGAVTTVSRTEGDNGDAVEAISPAMQTVNSVKHAVYVAFSVAMTVFMLALTAAFFICVMS